MTHPLVCAIMLTRDRPAMAARAVECFRRQTYERKFLFVFDTSISRALAQSPESEGQSCCWVPGLRAKSIGALRNQANAVMPQASILIHWDDDDWSHPHRIAEQVALLQSSGADAVGYREMLTWRQIHNAGLGEAWLYSHPSPSYALGASLCYWRKTWEQRPFEDVSNGEDMKFIEGLKVRTKRFDGIVDSIGDGIVDLQRLVLMHPPMIYSIHGGNTGASMLDPAAEVARGNKQWKRVPEWDDYCAERMKLS